MLAGDHGGEPSAAARQMADQRAHIPFGAGRRIPELIRPDAGYDIGRHAPGAAVEIPRIRHNVPSSTMTPAEPATAPAPTWTPSALLRFTRRRQRPPNKP
jgi:hypothetical protein